MQFNDSVRLNEWVSATPPVHFGNASMARVYADRAETACQLPIISAVRIEVVDDKDNWRSQVTCEGCRHIMDLVTGKQPNDARALLERAGVAGVQVVLDERGIREIWGEWWTQDLIDAICDRETEVVSVLRAPSAAPPEPPKIASADGRPFLPARHRLTRSAISRPVLGGGTRAADLV